MGWNGDMGPTGLGPNPFEPFEPIDGQRRLTFGRVAFMVTAALAVIVIVMYVVISSWLSIEGTFGVSDRPVNLLLLGTDRNYDDQGKQMQAPARADAIILASLNPKTRTTYVVSIPRDTRVKIPGRGTGKINASHVYGGRDLTTRTVQDLLGMPIDRCVELDFQGFVRIVDAIGGLEIDVEKDMKYVDRAGGFKVDLKKGRQVLDGEQALQYVRYRTDALGDIGRVGRHQNLLKTVVREFASLRSLGKAREIARILRDYMKTDMSDRDMASVGWFFARTRGSVVSETLPGQFSQYYWLPDASAIGEMASAIAKGFRQ